MSDVTRSFAAVVVASPDAASPVSASDDPVLRRLLTELTRTGVELVVVAQAQDKPAEMAAGWHGPGRLLSALADGSAAYAADGDGHRCLWGGSSTAGSDGGTGQGGAAPPSLMAWLFEDLWRRGIGPELVLVVASPDAGDQDVPPRAARVQGGDGTLREALAAQVARWSAGRVPWVDESPGWCVVLDGDRPARRRVDEALLTLADGRFGTRGSVEEDGAGSVPLLLAAGVYDARDPLVRLLPGPVWTGLDVEEAQGVTQRRVLDLRTGVLVREVAVAQGVLRATRFAAATRPGVAAFRAEAPAGALRAGPALLPPVGDTGYTEEALADGSTARTASSLGGGIAAVAVQQARTADGIESIDRVVVLRAETDRSPTTTAEVQDAWALLARGLPALLAEQRAAWAARWSDVDVVVDDDPEVQLGIRFALFHLLSSVADSGEAALGARGLSGDAYAGHVFWDADVYVLPVLAATNPSAARALLEYRVRRLPAARRAAAERGLQGVRFPWESAHDGREVTPPTARHPSGTTLRILTRDHAEHISADVAWGAWHYAAWTGDEAFLNGPGRPLLVETARYWASRMTYDRAGRGHLEQVVGPDEYHGPVDDNAFTNVMARWNLLRGAELLERAGILGTAARWRTAAASLTDGYDPASGLYEQFAGFFDLEPLLIEELSSVPVAADVLLGVERTAAAQVIKQADVLMLHHLVPEEVAPGSLEPNLDFYGPRTAHGSSLSPTIHASLLARAGRADEALRLLRLACRLDLDDLTGTTAGGLHIAALGGVWQAVVYGFAGVRPAQGMLAVEPVLPAAWTSLEVRVRFRGTPVHVLIDQETVDVRVDSDRPVPIRHGTRVTQVDRSGLRWPYRDEGDRR